MPAGSAPCSGPGGKATASSTAKTASAARQPESGPCCAAEPSEPWTAPGDRRSEPGPCSRRPGIRNARAPSRRPGVGTRASRGPRRPVVPLPRSRHRRPNRRTLPPNFCPRLEPLLSSRMHGQTRRHDDTPPHRHGTQSPRHTGRSPRSDLRAPCRGADAAAAAGLHAAGQLSPGAEPRCPWGISPAAPRPLRSAAPRRAGSPGRTWRGEAGVRRPLEAGTGGCPGAPSWRAGGGATAVGWSLVPSVFSTAPPQGKKQVTPRSSIISHGGIGHFLPLLNFFGYCLGSERGGVTRSTQPPRGGVGLSPRGSLFVIFSPQLEKSRARDWHMERAQTTLGDPTARLSL